MPVCTAKPGLKPQTPANKTAKYCQILRGEAVYVAPQWFSDILLVAQQPLFGLRAGIKDAKLIKAVGFHGHLGKAPLTDQIRRYQCNDLDPVVGKLEKHIAGQSGLQIEKGRRQVLGVEHEAVRAVLATQGHQIKGVTLAVDREHAGQAFQIVLTVLLNQDVSHYLPPEKG